METITEVLKLSLEQIVPSKTNPRKNFDESQMKELTASVKEKGILQPILVRPIGKNGTRKFEIVAGERRFRAAKELSLAEIPVIERELSDSEAMEIQVIENLQRADLHPLEEADSYKALMGKNDYSADDLAVKVGKSKAYIYLRLKLLSLCATARANFLKNKLSLSVALLFARIPEAKMQEQALKELSRESEHGEISYGMAWEHIQRNYMTLLEKAPFDTQDAKLLPEAGACATCPKRTGNQKELFPDIKRGDVCTDVICFQKKKSAAWVLTAKSAKEHGATVIDGAEAEKLCPYGHIERSSGYIDLNAQCYDDPKRRTWKQIIKKVMPHVTLVRDKQERVHELVRNSDLAEALKKAGVQIKQEKSGGDEHRKQAGKERQLAKVKQAVCAKALERLVKSMETYDFKDFSALVAPMVLRHVGYETLWNVAKRRGLVEKRADDCRTQLKKELPKLSETARKGFIVELLAAGDRWSSYGGFGENFKLACEDAKVDLTKIEGEVKTLLSKTKHNKKAR